MRRCSTPDPRGGKKKRSSLLSLGDRTRLVAANDSESEPHQRAPVSLLFLPHHNITEIKHPGVSSRALSFPFLSFGRARSGHAPWRTSAAAGGRMRRIPNCAPSWSNSCMLSSTYSFYLSVFPKSTSIALVINVLRRSCSIWCLGEARRGCSRSGVLWGLGVFCGARSTTAAVVRSGVWGFRV